MCTWSSAVLLTKASVYRLFCNFLRVLAIRNFFTSRFSKKTLFLGYRPTYNVLQLVWTPPLPPRVQCWKRSYAGQSPDTTLYGGGGRGGGVQTSIGKRCRFKVPTNYAAMLRISWVWWWKCTLFLSLSLPEAKVDYVITPFTLVNALFHLFIFFLRNSSGFVEKKDIKPVL